MLITYTFDRPLPLDAVQRLLAQTDWAAHRSPADLQTMLAGSVCVGAWQADRLVGFARVITDGVYRALLEDVVVDEVLARPGDRARARRKTARTPRPRPADFTGLRRSPDPLLRSIRL